MIYELLNTAIDQKNSFMTKEMIELQIEFFFEAGRISDTERETLLNKLNPIVDEPVNIEDETSETK